MKPWSEVKPQDNRISLFMIISPYGYIININNPEVLPFFKRYKEKHSIPQWAALSDMQRLEFEIALIHSKRFKQRFDDWFKKYKYLMPYQTKEKIEMMIGVSHAKRK